MLKSDHHFLPVSPLLFATIRGNLQMFPVPTTHPRHDRIRPHLVENTDDGYRLNTGVKHAQKSLRCKRHKVL